MADYLFIIFWTNLFIYLFYLYFKTHFPEDYFGPNDEYALAISVSLKRLLLFRIFPVLLINLTVFSYLNMKMDILSWVLLGVFSTGIYAFFTSGTAVIKLFINSPTIKIFTNKPTQFLYHISSIVLLLLIGIVAGLISSLRLTEQLSGGVKSLYDNLVASIIYTAVILPFLKFYKYWTRTSELNVDQIIQNSILDIRSNGKLYKKIEDICKLKKANLSLVLAFCVVENIQRPKWFRAIENLQPFRATRGIMQVTSKKIITDEESVDMAVSKYFKNTETVLINSDFLSQTAARYNGKLNEKYTLFLERALDNIDYSILNK